MCPQEQLNGEIDTPCLWQDLLQQAFDSIDWIEVVENNTEEVRCPPLTIEQCRQFWAKIAKITAGTKSRSLSRCG